MKLSKEVRERIWNKYGQRCAYCGKDLLYNKMQVDHIQAHWRKYSDNELQRIKIIRGSHAEVNFNPSCARCNRWKGTFNIEQFRNEISMQCQRLKRDSNQYRMAYDFGLINETSEPVQFWFERYNKVKVLNNYQQ